MSRPLTAINDWSDAHARCLAEAFKKLMKKARPGKVYFIRNPPLDVLYRLPSDDLFCEAMEAEGWQAFRVADRSDPRLRAVRSDQAVAMREAKRQAVVFLVDTEKAGPGMDGIYSAGAELREDELFEKACKLALEAIDESFHPRLKRILAFAKKRAAHHSGWFRFDFLARVVGRPEQWPEYLWLLGLWPCAAARLTGVKRKADEESLLAEAATLTDALLGVGGARLAPEARMAQAGVRAAAPETLAALQTFLAEQGRRPTDEALRALRERPDLWLGPLYIEPPGEHLEAIELVGWRAARGGPGAQPLKWSGLTLDQQEQTLIWPVDPEADDAPPLTVKWRPQPATLAPGSLQYRVAMVGELGETLAEREVVHAGKTEEKTAFTADDLPPSAAWLPARIIVEAEGKQAESEPFVIRPGHVEAAAEKRASVRRLRTLSEGLIELDDAAAVAGTLDNAAPDAADGHLTLHINRSRRFQIGVPALFREVARHWRDHHAEEIGRWRLTVQASGRWASAVEFIRFPPNIGTPMKLWHRACRASCDLAAYAGRMGLAGLCYVEGGPSAQVIGDYLDAWGDLLDAVVAQPESGGAPLPLAGTIEIRAQNGRAVGLIVPPTHPLRLAWLAAYDALLFHARWSEGASAEDARREFRVLDGAWLPAWLPGVGDAPAFVFADALGFHAAAMTRADATEPKADTLWLARALENRERLDDETSPSFVGRRVFERLGAEIKAYADGHPHQRHLHVHAVRAGDGLTLARALGWARAADEAPAETDEAAPGKAPLSFALELYAPNGGGALAGGFLDRMTARRRARGRAAVPAEDRWMMEAQPGAGSRPQPSFQWARRPAALPEAPAHLGIAFDAFAAEVTAAARPPLKGDAWPLYGLLSGLIRTYRASPTPVWEAFLPDAEKVAAHPAGAMHTQRLRRLRQGMERWPALERPGASSRLRATLTPKGKAELDRLHELCDWVVTFDRFAGVEYFDHPQAHPDVYETYVIDHLPERDDLGDARIVVSTALAAEVVELLSSLLKQAQLPEDAEAARFLLRQLKALSRRLPMRLAGAHPPARELLALAYAAAYCAAADADDPCWLSLRSGFLAPLDDIRDLLPASSRPKAGGGPERRADFLYVSLASDGRLRIRIIEVKYRRSLASFSDEQPDALLDDIRAQVEDTRKRFRDYYLRDALPKSFRALRQARLLRVMKSYADKAARHHLDAAVYDALCAELDRALDAAGGYVFDLPEGADRGWVFCPTFDGARPLELSRASWPVPTFRFGPLPLEPSAGRNAAAPPPKGEVETPREVIETSRMTAAEAASGPQETSRTQDQAESEAADPPPEAAPPESLRADADIRLGYAPNGEPVNWRLTVRGNPHLLVVGLPGMGKTTCLVNIARQMRAQGICPIVFSYAPDFDEKLAAGAGGADFIEVGRLDFNPLEVTDRETPRAYVHVAGVIKDIFAAIYPDLGEIQLSALRRAIVESFEAAGWSESATGETPSFGRFVEILHRTPRPDAGMRNLLARLDELWDYGFFDAPPAERQQSLWTRRRPVVVPLHRQPTATLQTGLATLAFYKLYKDMFQRGLAAGITHAVIFDEAHRARRLALIPTMAKECRKYGVSLVLASQEARDFDRSLFSAIGQQLALRVNEPDARALTQNAAASGRQRALADELKALPKFQAIYFGEAGTATRCRLLDDAGT